MINIEQAKKFMSGKLPDYKKREFIIDLKNLIFYNNISEVCKKKGFNAKHMRDCISFYGGYYAMPDGSYRYKECVLKAFDERTGLTHTDGRQYNIVLRINIAGVTKVLVVFMDGERRLYSVDVVREGLPNG